MIKLLNLRILLQYFLKNSRIAGVEFELALDSTEMSISQMRALISGEVTNPTKKDCIFFKRVSAKLWAGP